VKQSGAVSGGSVREVIRKKRLSLRMCLVNKDFVTLVFAHDARCEEAMGDKRKRCETIGDA